MSRMNLGNARDPQQITRMKALQAAGKCYFCRQGSAADGTLAIPLHELEYWYIKPNDYPLDGSVAHYLIVPKRHLTDVSGISPEEAVELHTGAIPWLKAYCAVTGYSLFVRSGDMRFTGATLDHIHWHFLVGDTKPDNATLEDAVPVVIAYKKKK